MSITDPLRAEHADLWAHLDALDMAARDLPERSGDLSDRLAAAMRFLRGHLVHHARAEETALYLAVERALAPPHP